jgi:glycosyltransferase involved in cell wall biosynthesis
MRKLVSVLTGTYNRPKEIRNCIKEVRKQDYPNVEHVIVSATPDKQLRELVEISNKYDIAHKITYAETGRQWSQFLANSISAVEFQMAQWLAKGDYLMWFADDEEITPDHISSLVDLLEREDVDFVYSQTEVWFNPSLKSVYLPRVIGGPVPRCGDITQALYRVELLDYRGFRTHVGSGTDWDQVKSWMDAGASWAFLERVTHTHRVDKWGDVDARTERQLLRGNRHKHDTDLKNEVSSYSTT